jgi:DMSO reductase family type II enzyme heme b subunit
MWHVVITTPMATESANSPRFEPGGSSVAAFAVWEGGSREVGSRKAWSSWVPLKFAK